MTATVAYIVVSWNNADLLPECIASIDAQTYPNRRVIVVDNGSNDGSVALLQRQFDHVEVLAQTDNLGFAKGNNVGIAHVLADPDVAFVALVNSDATLAPDWTQTLVDFAARKPKAAALQSITLDYYDHEIIDTSHLFVAHNGQATQGSYRRPIFENADNAPQRVFGCNAAAVIYTRRFIEAQPFRTFFDEEMFMYLEDVDVAARATVMGWDNYVVPGTRAFHMGSASSSRRPGWSLYMTFRNNTGLLIKNFPRTVLLRVLPRLVYGDLQTWFHLWQTDRTELIRHVIKGRLAGVFKAWPFLKKRKLLAPTVAIDEEELWQLMRRGH